MSTETQRANVETDPTAAPRGAVEILLGVVARLTEAQRLCSSTREVQS